MKANDAFPSKYLAAADLNGNDVLVKITHVEPGEIGNKEKLICYFAGKKKGLVLNKTNFKAIVKITGQEDTDDWTGCEICLYPTMVDFQGDSVPAIRIKAAPARNGHARQSSADMGREHFPNDRPAPPKRMTGGMSDQAMDDGRRAAMDDEIPFAPEFR